MEIIYTDIQPMSPRATRSFIRENSHLLHARHVDKLYTDGTSYWYIPKKIVPYKSKSVKIRTPSVKSTRVKTSHVRKYARVSKTSRVRTSGR
jgi:hypothetical protein